MPYRRRYKKKRKGRYSNRKPSKVAYKAYKIARFLGKSIEPKHINTDISETDIDEMGVFTTSPLNNPAPGTGDQERIGDSIYNNTLHIRMRVTNGADNLQRQLRVLCFWDKQGTITDPNQLIDNVGIPLGVVSQYVVDRRMEWSKIFDRSFVFDGVRSSVFQFNKKFKIHKTTKFDAGSSTINTGAIVIMYLSNADPLQTSAEKPNVSGTARVWYTDA